MSNPITINAIVSFINEFSEGYKINKYYDWVEGDKYIFTITTTSNPKRDSTAGMLAYNKLTNAFEAFNPMDYPDDFPMDTARFSQVDL